MKNNLDNEDQAILDSFEKGEWRPVADKQNEIKKHVNYARATIRRYKKVNIRISESDFESLKKIAIQEGISYQALISSL